MRNIRNWRIRVLSLALCLASVIALVQPVAAAQQAMTNASEFTYTTLVRYRASKASAVIGQMENGTAVTVLEERGDFYKIDCYDMTGYIAKEQVSLKRDGTYYVKCNLKSDETSKMELLPQSEAVLLRVAILSLAKKQVGYPYVYGGFAPGGFDCSGLTYYLYGQFDYALRRCADEQLENGLIVAKEGLQVGDLLFFREAGSPWLASHVGIYAGDNQMIHASSRGICYSNLDADYYKNYYLCARRIINADIAEIHMPSAGSDTAIGRSLSAGIRTAN